ncbi:MAG: AAA family ATPase [Candidatus Moranbacteria bacterium]|nr:AAA family ATPase [Candidatus Moranbacteria bacterium]
MEKIVLGITGEIAGGKGTITAYLEDKHGASSAKFSSALRDVAKRMHLEENRENLQKISTMFRENFNGNILSEVIYEDVKEMKSEIIVIDGVRRMADIEFLKRLPGFRLIYTDASMENRFERITQRGENADDNTKTFEDFKKDHEREAELQIKGLKNEADFVVDNNGTLKELYDQIDKIIKGLKEKK